MTAEVMREAVGAGHTSGEWAACCWAWDYAETHQDLPSGKEIRAGVLQDYGGQISNAAAYRGREMALSLILRVCFARQKAAAQ